MTDVMICGPSEMVYRNTMILYTTVHPWGDHKQGSSLGQDLELSMDVNLAMETINQSTLETITFSCLISL